MNTVTVRVSSKGQIVIPKNLREAFHIVPGAEFVVVAVGDEIHLKPAAATIKQTTVEAGLGLLSARAGRPIPDKEIRRLIGQRLLSLDKGSKDNP